MTGLSALTLFEAYQRAAGSLRLPLTLGMRKKRSRQALHFEAALREKLAEADECIRYVGEMRRMIITMGERNNEL